MTKVPPFDPVANEVESIREDLACPACGYNLRGLVGDLIRCPECGVSCDVAALVTARWTKPWYRAPRLTTVLWPAGAAYIGGLVVIALYATTSSGSVDWPAGLNLLALGMLLVVWCFVLYETCLQFTEAWLGLWLALLGHVALLGIVGGLGWAGLGCGGD